VLKFSSKLPRDGGRNSAAKWKGVGLSFVNSMLDCDYLLLIKVKNNKIILHKKHNGGKMENML
jgi:hypothetical protein